MADGRMPGERDYLLMHPAQITQGGGLEMFSAVVEGETVTMMHATVADLVSQMSEITKPEYAGEAVEAFCAHLRGAISVNCGGCLLAIGQDAVSDMSINISAALQRKPFLGMFTYGETGIDANRRTRHGSLMYSMLLFGKEKTEISE